MAVQLAFGCSERTARRRIRESVKTGALCHTGQLYWAAPTVETSRRGSKISQGSALSERVEIRVGSLPRARVDRLEFLRRVDKPYKLSSLTELIVQLNGCSARTARTTIRCAELFGYVERCDGRYRRTAEATVQLETWGRLHGVEGERFARFCSGRPMRFGAIGLPRSRL